MAEPEMPLAPVAYQMLHCVVTAGLRESAHEQSYNPVIVRGAEITRTWIL
jgi:hypothetical protein